MNLVLTSVLAWRIAALAVWLALAVGAVEIVTHVFRLPPRRHVRTPK